MVVLVSIEGGVVALSLDVTLCVDELADMLGQILGSATFALRMHPLVKHKLTTWGTLSYVKI